MLNEKRDGFGWKDLQVSKKFAVMMKEIKTRMEGH